MTDEPCIYSEAAKEIERLRKELDIYKDLYAAEIVEKAMKK
jgi:predicted translin family RNA/ssDNA-binding protein